jgi:uncharacterized ferritin-like protein (DUF455 family)
MSLSAAAVTVLTTADPAEKVRLTHRFAEDWREGRIAEVGTAEPPDRPARPDRPELRLPRDMPPRRKGGSVAGRTALLHALAHIELNAIDLAWDIVARFGAGLPKGFSDDWVQVADDEARHFDMLCGRMAELGSGYGALPAHDGLWQASRDTAHDLAARLAVVPMVLEARGLDVTPAMIENLRRFGDDAGADALQIIHDDEITHVAAGRRWFEYVCAERGVEPIPTWQHLVQTHFKGGLKRPFNAASRDKAGFAAAFYEPIAE